jgi:hypothetical protein
MTGNPNPNPNPPKTMNCLDNKTDYGTNIAVTLKEKRITLTTKRVIIYLQRLLQFLGAMLKENKEGLP